MLLESALKDLVLIFLWSKSENGSH
jgi:hypothetical protein